MHLLFDAEVASGNRETLCHLEVLGHTLCFGSMIHHFGEFAQVD